MDSIPDRQFMYIFDRVTAYIDLKDCETPEDIEERVSQAIYFMRTIVRKAKKKSTRKKWRSIIRRTRSLIREGVPAKSPKLKGKTRMGFQTRAVEHAMLHPRRAIALTLFYGKKRARRILRERARRKKERIARRFARR